MAIGVLGFWGSVGAMCDSRRGVFIEIDRKCSGTLTASYGLLDSRLAYSETLLEEFGDLRREGQSVRMTNLAESRGDLFARIGR